jgi:hypothetical protein
VPQKTQPRKGKREMKLTKLIERLEDYKSKNGDVDVFTADPERLVNDGKLVRGNVHFLTSEDDGSLLLVDGETQMAFK